MVFGLDSAHAQSSDAARAALERATSAERAGEPRAALEAWRAVVDAAPGSRLAARAASRIAWIEARSEGDLVPLATWLRYQAMPSDARSSDVVSALERDLAAMPRGRVRLEARQAIAEDWLRLGDAARARIASEAWLGETGASETERRMAQEALARALELEGRRGDAIAMLEGAGLAEREVHATLARAELERWTTPPALAVIGVYVLAALAGAALALRRRGLGALRGAWTLPRAAAAAWIACGPIVLATLYDDEATDTFALLAAGTLGVAALAALGATGIEGRAARAGLAALAALAQICVAWLVLLGSGGLISFL